jgi:hypothetical protein
MHEPRPGQWERCVYSALFSQFLNSHFSPGVVLFWGIIDIILIMGRVVEWQVKKGVLFRNVQV